MASRQHVKRTRRSAQTTRVGGVLFTTWRKVAPYVRRWHAVNDWASDVLGLADEVFVTQPNPRVAKRRAQWVRDAADNEEAYDRGRPLEDMGGFPRGPKQVDGGRRRVLVRAYTWTLDEAAGSVYEPLWITLGVGHTARQATDGAERYIRSYMFAVSRGVESRRLVVTAIEVVWWTASQSVDYV